MTFGVVEHPAHRRFEKVGQHPLTVKVVRLAIMETCISPAARRGLAAAAPMPLVGKVQKYEKL